MSSYYDKTKNKLFVKNSIHNRIVVVYPVFHCTSIIIQDIDNSDHVLTFYTTDNLYEELKNAISFFVS